MLFIAFWGVIFYAHNFRFLYKKLLQKYPNVRKIYGKTRGNLETLISQNDILTPFCMNKVSKSIMQLKFCYGPMNTIYSLYTSM